MEDIYRSVSELAREHGTSRESIYGWVRRGDIPEHVVRLDRGIILVEANAFAGLIRAGKIMKPRGPKKQDRVAELIHVLSAD